MIYDETITPMTTEEYYITPAEHIFQDIKRNAKKIWSTYDDSCGYATEKLERIDIENIADNAWYIVAMFDQPNQNKLLDMVEPETAREIRRARGY